eukprot:88872_1
MPRRLSKKGKKARSNSSSNSSGGGIAIEIAMFAIGALIKYGWDYFNNSESLQQRAQRVIGTVDQECNAKMSALDDSYVVINRQFNMTDYPKDISASILSVVESSFPCDGKNNIKWLVQQIVHCVCSTRTVINANVEICRASHRSVVDGDKLKMKVAFHSFVFCEDGGCLSTDNINGMKIKFVMGFQSTKDDKCSMSPNTVRILDLKATSPSDEQVVCSKLFP